LSAEQKLGSGTLAVTGIHARKESVNRFDATPVVSLLRGAKTPTAESRPSNAAIRIFELRYTTDTSGPLRYVVGAYYYIGIAIFCKRPARRPCCRSGVPPAFIRPLRIWASSVVLFQP
jgi:hypothetical protein